MKTQHSLLLVALIGFLAASDLEARPERGYLRDEYGHLLIFRQQPSWFALPCGVFLTGAGAAGAFLVLKKGVHVSTHANIPLGYGLNIHASSHDTTTDRIFGMLGCVFLSAGGIAVLYDWHYHYSRLDEPYIILDKLGMWYEGQGQINWKDLKGVRMVEEPIRDNEGRKIGTRLQIEVVEIQKRWKIDDSRLNITREALYDFILEYCEAATGKNPRIT